VPPDPLHLRALERLYAAAPTNRHYRDLRLEIGDARWQRAMSAIRDAMRVVGSKTYVRCYMRDHAEAAWEPVVLDLARV